MAEEKELVLYYKPTCPFCAKVLDFMEEDGIELPLRNILTDDAALKTLIEVGGKKQVPCLFIDGKPMYESGDIVKWLRKNPQQ
jgi:glutaredoxin